MEADVRIRGVNGDVVTIAGPDAGKEGIWLATEVEGLVDVTATAVSKAYGGRPGSKFISSRITDRPLVFRVTIENDEADAWQSRDIRWRKLWSFDEYAKVEVRAPGFPWRSLSVRLEEIQVNTDFDPHVNQATDVLMTVKADDPFWYEPKLEVPLKPVGDAGEYEATVPVLNPTPFEVFPVYELAGGACVWSVPNGFEEKSTGEAVQRVRLNVPVGASGALVDTDPGARQVQDTTNTMVWGLMNGVRFTTGIPPYSGEGTVTVKRSELSSAASVTMIIPRPFTRPWGDA